LNGLLAVFDPKMLGICTPSFKASRQPFKIDLSYCVARFLTLIILFNYSSDFAGLDIWIF